MIVSGGCSEMMILRVDSRRLPGQTFLELKDLPTVVLDRAMKSRGLQH